MLALEIFIFGGGLVIGSFLNVVALRYNTGRSLQGRSGCFSCGAKLSWYELVPVFSYLVQLGRCRSCGARLSLQYPLVELLMGFLFWALFGRLFEGEITLNFTLAFGFYAVITCLLVVIVIYDLKHKIIPNGLVYPTAAIALVGVFFDFEMLTFMMPPFTHILAGPLLALPFALLWLISQGRWMGLGDAKLALVLGWLLGLTGGITAVLFAFWGGALVSLSLLCVSHVRQRGSTQLSYLTTPLTMKSEVPFAPFLIAGLWAVLFTGFDLIGVLVASW